MCTEMASESAHEIGFADEAGAGFLRFRFGQIRTPGDNVHIERFGVAGHTGAEAAEADDAERLPGKPHPDGDATLEAAGSHRPIGDRDGAGGGDQQAERQFRGRVGRARGCRQPCCRPVMP